MGMSLVLQVSDKLQYWQSESLKWKVKITRIRFLRNTWTYEYRKYLPNFMAIPLTVIEIFHSLSQMLTWCWRNRKFWGSKKSAGIILWEQWINFMPIMWLKIVNCSITVLWNTTSCIATCAATLVSPARTVFPSNVTTICEHLSDILLADSSCTRKKKNSERN